MFTQIEASKKFKKAWIEKAKIKSQWKAQKKKEGLAERSKLDIPVYDEQDDSDDESEEGQGPLAPSPSPPPWALEEDVRESQLRASNENQPHRARSDHKGKATRRDERQDPAKKRKVQSEGEGGHEKREGDNVRELMREAYSIESLHTFKADPLKRRTATGRQRGEKGRGQPNMKLRMNAMLAKIKQDYT
ncbi:hypothetical protein CPB83DRAFT_889957 [Crepidotus variabilis]|uniref:Uncharacterized protein n=1 Tax=Crepidotus variabilis TaxID=179855 RepID=A0A9P6EQN8_9AGAR|nr:hypothetical protein CPB83DRAFT_889957 [Crepidotus variabilis]